MATEEHKKEKQRYIVSAGIDRFFYGFYNVAAFIAHFFRELVVPPYEIKETVRQCFSIGYKSLSLITITGLITGIVFTHQSRQPIVEFGAIAWLPSIIAIAVIRSLAPLVTSIICAGKVGSGIGAELGAMRVTEQIDAMEVSASNPFKFLVVSRVVASTLMLPILMMYFGFFCMLGSFIDMHMAETLSFTAFLSSFFQKITFFDYVSSIIRSAIFGFTIGIVGCYFGYNATRGTEGVGKASNMAVVASMYLLFMEEVLITGILNIFHTN